MDRSKSELLKEPLIPILSFHPILDLISFFSRFLILYIHSFDVGMISFLFLLFAPQ